ncbi:hypothetical protein ABD91_10870 [Lysinibacillus sphaericus]|uniref:phage NrS-1 polymerase family protein n=1 Tax=Lysinibacillus sphaericus TaxID=1421 RepID=UPI0018CCF9BB|nr:DUF927 domain-containing protein [Lysinibacillus sphaericus]MBG9691374.1 hypothetical protein [Lysinibacillus sphaericus]
MKQEINYSYDSIPNELKELKQWVCFEVKSVPGKEKLEKIPWHYSGKFKASSTNPNTWCTFDEAVATAQKRINGINAIGFAFSENDSYIGIDLDDVFDENNLNEMANKIIDIADSYTEYSTSRTGVHIIIKGALPDYIKSTGKRNDKYGIEIYSSGRMFVFTGDVIANEESIYERSDQLGEIIEKYFSKEQLADYSGINYNEIPIGTNTENDSDTWKRMLLDKKVVESKGVTHGELIHRAIKGELTHNNDHSETDMYLIGQLAYFCKCDSEKIDRMYRNGPEGIGNALMRDKWDERRGATTYGERTIVIAIANEMPKLKAFEKKEFEMISPNGTKVMLKIPEGYISKKGCLYKVSEKMLKDGSIERNETFICRQTPVITRTFTNIEYQQLYHELTWSDNGRDYKVVVPAGDLAIRKEMLKLSYQSLAVTENNVKHLIQYFDTFIMVNQLNREHLVERLGYIKGEFVHPLNATQITILPADAGERQLLNAFNSSGTIDDWIGCILNPMKKHSRALLMLLASFTSVILKDLKLQPFIVDLSGPTSRGKTTVLRACASVWGTEHLVSEWNITKVSAERKASFLNSFPLILDDSRKADSRQLQSFVYNFSGGRSRGRGSITGSQMESTWNNILLSTGEASLNEYAVSAGGVAARILSITGIPFENEEFSFFNNIYEAIDGNYGVVGMEFLKQWQERKNTLISEFAEYNSLFQKASQGNEVISRIARYYAAIVFTAKLLNVFFNCEIDLKVLFLLFEELNKENKSLDKPLQLLELILQELDTDRGAIYRNNSFGTKTIKAFYKAGTLYFAPNFLKETLKTEEKATRNEWLRRGITIERENRGKKVDYQQLKISGQKFSGIAVQPKILQELGFDFSEESRY